MKMRKPVGLNLVLSRALRVLLVDHPICPVCRGYVISPPNVRTEDGTYHAKCYEQSFQDSSQEKK